jgi:aryl-alcohol dehydrogenase-like predicted oxidoreductase
MDKRRLGKTAIEVTPIGLGCWQFGSGITSSLFWKAVRQSDVDKIVRIALEGGINWFDTAELYGSGSSERALSTALTNAGQVDGKVVIATKWTPFFRTAGSIARTVSNRERNLTPFKIDLYQIHQPMALAAVKAQMNAMADLVQEAKVGAIGVSNFSEELMRKSHRALAERGLPLASNQVRFNLLDRSIEKNGVLDAAKELGVTIIAYSPLAQGLLTGKFHKNPELVSRLPFMRRLQISRMIDESRPLIEKLEGIAISHRCSVSEVALSWVINFHEDSIVAIPGATKEEQVQENVGAMTVELSLEEMSELDKVSRMITS